MYVAMLKYDDIALQQEYLKSLSDHILILSPAMT